MQQIGIAWRDEAGGEIKCEKAVPNVADFEDGTSGHEAENMGGLQKLSIVTN